MFIYQYFFNILLTATNIFAQIYLINELSINEYGKYALILSFFPIITVLSGLGIAGSFQLRFPNLSSSNKDALVFYSLKNQIKVLLVLIMLFLLFFGGDLIGWLAALYMFLTTINNTCFRDNLVVRGNFKYLYTVQVIAALIKIFTMYYFVNFYEFSPETAILALIICEVFILFFIRVKRSNDPRMELPILKMFSKNRFFIQSKFAEVFMLKIPAIWALAFFHDEIAVGEFAFVTTLAFMLGQNISPLRRLEVILNRITLEAGNIQKELRDSAITLHCLISVLLLIGLTIYEPLLFDYVLDGKYQDIYWIFLLILPSLFLSHFVYAHHCKLYLTNDIKKISNSIYVGAFINILGIILLVPDYSIIGASFSLIIGYLAKLTYLAITLQIKFFLRSYWLVPFIAGITLFFLSSFTKSILPLELSCLLSIILCISFIIRPILILREQI